MKQKSFTINTKPLDQTYLIGSSPLSVGLPTYAWTPPQATTNFIYDLVNPPNFITITDSPLEIQVSTSDYSNTGSYTILIVTTETYSGLKDTQKFNLVVTCVTAIAPSSQIQTIVYFIGDDQI